VTPTIDGSEETGKVDLSNRGLEVIPDGIFALESLTHLNLRGNQLRKFDDRICELSLLEDLDLGSNHLEQLSPGVGKLRRLRRLYLKGNQLKLLPVEIRGLSSLRSLNLRDNRLEALPPTIGALQSLTELYLNNNRLTVLPHEICQLTGLQLLDLRDNSLPYLEEVLNNTGAPKKIIEYLRRVFAINDGTVPLCEAKVLMIGQGGAGKTSIVKRLAEEAFDRHEGETRGINIRGFALGPTSSQMVANIWDFGGQEIMHATHQFFFTKRSVYVLVLDSRQGDYEGRIVEYWLKLIQGVGANSPVIVVCNKCDENPMALDWTGLSSKYPFIKAFVKRVSCSTGEGIQELRAAIEREARHLEHVSDRIPQSWLLVKRDLEQMNDNYISYQRYEAVCSARGVTEEAERGTLVGLLHDLGVVLHYRDDPALTSVGVLNPNWVTSGVYRILNSQILDDNGGIVDSEDLLRILGASLEYAGQLDFLLALMRKFELCFELREGREPKYLIPNVLRRDEPETGDWTDGLRFQIEYSVLPNSVISRFMVRMRSYVLKGTYWRTGVVLVSRSGDAKALVKADLESHRITIIVKGAEASRSPFLNVLRTELRELVRGIPGIEAREFLVVPGHSDAIVSYDYLLQLQRMGQPTIIPPGVEEVFTIDSLLAGVDRKEFDVFLSYRLEDEGEVSKIARELHEEAIEPWFARRELQPGLDRVKAAQGGMDVCQSAALFIGKNGWNAWNASEELADLQSRFAGRGKSVIPVLLPSAPEDIGVPHPLLSSLRHVDYRTAEGDPLRDLIWGITGRRTFVDSFARRLHRFSLLHLSDLHERVELDGMDDERKSKIRLGKAARYRVLEDGYFEALKEVLKLGPLDAVCFTGDVADCGLNEEYQQATVWFENVLKSVHLQRDRLFAVPGNHDVDRGKAQKAWNALWSVVRQKPRELSNRLGAVRSSGGSRDSDVDGILDRTVVFWDWLSGFRGADDLRPSCGPHGRLGYRHVLKVREFPFPVQIIGFDSAWLAGDDDSERLLLSEGQVDRLCTDDKGKPLEGLRLALVHHPLSSLIDGDTARSRFGNYVDLLLHGHQHKPLAETRDGPDSSLLVLAAGALFEGDEGDNWLNAFQRIDVSVTDEGCPVSYDVTFWGWSPNGYWHRTGAIYQAAREGKLTIQVQPRRC
jgi:internalin A